MSTTVQKINLEPVSDLLPITRRDFPLATPALANPLNSDALVDGEWMRLNSNYQIARAADIAAEGNTASDGVHAGQIPSYPLFAERGRYDTQAIAGRKMPILYMGEYEFDTRIFKNLLIVGAGGANITYVGQPLKVASIQLTLATGGVKIFSGLVGSTPADTDFVVGWVTRLSGNNGGKLRFKSGYRR